MSMLVGIDVGAVGIKAAVLIRAGQGAAFVQRSGQRLQVLAAPDGAAWDVLVVAPRRTRGRPLDVTRELLIELLEVIPADQVRGLAVTGSGSALLGEVLGAATCNEFQAATRAVDLLHPQVRTVFEIGGETSRYLRLEPDPGSGTLGIVDYSANGDCAAGTGAFLDQQAGRLNYKIEEIGTIVDEAERAAQIAGRCSVFAKSDMIHAQQKGFVPSEVLRGLCNAVATNFRSAVVRGRTPVAPVALLGGVAANTAVVRGLRETFELDEDALFVPAAAESLPAIGAALAAAELADETQDAAAQLARLQAATKRDGDAFPRTRPLTLDRVTLLRDEVKPYDLPADGTQVDAYLGLDIGSVGTKLVLIDEGGDVVHSIFTRTEGRPIEVVTRCLRELEEAVGWAVRIRGVGTTGSGRELIGELVGADAITDEITCHKTGAAQVGERLIGKRPDTILEIGGQDSKYIRLEAEGTEARRHGGTEGGESIVVDFTMNEACAAGTGSFLEERAEELGVSIKGEFAELALSSTAPIRLGERCTVFMERDVNTYMRRGAERADVIAGLAYSIALNYVNRVVRGRPIGDCIFFQGGTAYNDAVAAAFSIICDKEIIVPPHNAVLGAIGAALLAREKVAATGGGTRFRGYDMAQVDYKLREFACHGCGNQCAIQEFTVEDEKTFWGDKCSERFRKQVKSERKPIIEDLVALRHKLLMPDGYTPPSPSRGTIGIPLAMYTWDLLPAWRRFFHDCGFEVVLSQETNRQTVRRGFETVVSEPCFPIIVGHGHVAELIERDVDYVWLPNLITASTRTEEHLDAFVCPWGQTLPFVVRQSPTLRHYRGRILCPLLSFQDGRTKLEKVMVRVAKDLGVPSKVARQAFARALDDLDAFRRDYGAAGRQALEQVLASDEPGMVLVGRPYNIHDAGVSLSVARKLREQYGVNVLPIDALPLDDIDIDAVTDNMYWAYGRKILAAGRLVAQHTNLHVIYVTNFKCGPDSFLKGLMRPATDGKPLLTLQFDGHSNDAGMMTRCEAYLDSKGILRWWRTCRSKPTDQLLPDEPSTSRKWRTPVPG
jgi:predicted CoA-substrate-specific enzyme activase